MKIIHRVPIELWKEVADSCPHATFYHTPAWTQFYAPSDPETGPIATKAFEFNSGEIAVLPLVELGRECKGFFRYFYSNVRGVYGGLISTVVLSPEKIARIQQYLENIRTYRIQIFGNPYADEGSALNGWTADQNSTHVFHLNGYKTEEDLLASYPKEARNKVRRAEKAGIAVARAESMDEVRDYYEIYRKALERWGAKATNQYPFELFEKAYSLRDQNFMFWIVKYEGRVIGGSLNLMHNKRCFGWHWTAMDEYLNLGIKNYLIHKTFWDALQAGATVFDMNPSGGHVGTEKFKENCGAKKTPFTSWTWDKNRAYQLFHSVRTFGQREQPIGDVQLPSPSGSEA